MDPWTLVYQGFDPQKEALREALCTLGNGYFATRGASAQADADDVHYPGTYLAGGYNRLKTKMSGRVIENEDLVNMPNWLVLKFRTERGDWFNVKDVTLHRYRQELHLKQGLLIREMDFEDAKGRKSRLKERRLVHMGNPHLAALETTFTPLNWSGRLEVETALDGGVINSGVKRYRKLSSKHLKGLETEAVDEETVFLRVQTSQSRIEIAQASRTRIYKNGTLLNGGRKLIRKQGYIAQRIGLHAEAKEPLRMEKVISLFTSRDHAVTESGLEARKAVNESEGFDGLLGSHALTWQHLWRRFEMSLKYHPDHGKDNAELMLNLNLFHLLQTSSIHTMDLDVGIPSRGWHGEAYRGHIFWDELFIFPMLNFRIPEITRSLLMYRYRRLDEARRAARKEGLKGAMYPWQSGSNGREESQEVHLNPKSGRWLPDNSRLQRHVNAAIAFNIHQYYQCTGDLEFISFYGAEMFLEIARFWSSMTRYNRKLDRYEILGVMGPDEYHDGYPDSEKPGLNNSAYTNVMAAWVLNEALNILDLLSEDQRRELCEKIHLTQKEIDRWRKISRKMRLVFHDNGIISQFEGYDRLKEFDWEGYRRKYDDIQRLDRVLEAEDDTPNQYKVSKQADVLMLFYLFSAEELKEIFQRLGYDFPSDTIPKNIEYYIERTSHGSTLSRVVHSWVLARSDRERSWRFCKEALGSDYMDIQGGTTPEGIHLGAMAGSVNIIQEGYTGLKSSGDVLRFNPCLPKELQRLQMEVRYRGHSLHVDITQDSMEVSTCPCVEKAIRIGFGDEIHELEGGEIRKLPLPL